ncbi:MAG: choice-of-anchor D domain-containing protein [Deltaproteobacteria bacterium]|nr:choice-of-anchor D domain-containing protein [Deltaproteobacteria bacterium]
MGTGYSRRWLSGALCVAGMFLLARCAGCNPSSNPVDDEGTGDVGAACSTPGACRTGLLCVSGTCQAPNPVDGGGSSSSSSSSSGSTSSGGADGGGGDASVPTGVLTITPFPEAEFGAQRIGTPVGVNIFATNTGNAPFTVILVLLDGNPTSEFAAEPTGSLNRVMQPQDELVIRVTHTPADGTPDRAQLKLVTSLDPSTPVSVDLVAVFKGTPVVSVTTDVAQVSPSITATDLGLAPLGTTLARQVYVRNTGAANSVLTLQGLTVTPLSGAFAATAGTVAGRVLSPFTGFCGTGGTCPADHPTCQGTMCIDADGVTADTLVVTVEFTPTAAGPTQAILTLSHTDGTTDAQTSITLDGSGARGVLSVTPGAVDFGTVFVGRRADRPVVLQNVGDATLAIDLPAVTGAAAFTSDATAALVLAPAQAASVVLRVEPQLPGPLAGTLQIRGPDIEPLDVPLSANARHAPEILVEPWLSFGSVYVDTTRTLPLRIRNGGPGALSILSIAVEGTAAGRYSLSPPSFPDALDPLAAPTDNDPSLRLDVSYRPLGPPNLVEDRATLVLTTDDPDAPRAEVTLSGLGVHPVVVVQPTSLSFGDVRVGGVPAERTLTVYNNGIGPLSLTSLSTGGGAFVLANPPLLPAAVSLGAPLVLTVRFTPAGLGAASDVLNITSDDVATPLVAVPLSGNGALGALTPTPASLAFGEVFVARTERATVSVQNTGTADVQVTGARVDGNSAFRWVAPGTPFTLAPAATRALEVEFAPIAEGQGLSAQAVLETDLPTPLIVQLSGSARAEPTVLVPASVDFGSVDTLSTRVLDVPIRNLGPGLLSVTSLTITGPGAARFAATPTGFAGSLPPLATPSSPTPAFTLAVSYQPAAPVTLLADVATLHVFTDDPDTPDATVELAGVGRRPVVGVNPLAVTFPDTRSGTASSPITVSVFNNGAGPLTLTALEIAGAAFSLAAAPALPTTVLPSSPATLGVVFAPSSVGSATGTLTVRTDDLANPAVTLTLSGNGTQGLLVAEPAALSFGDTFTGRTYTRTVTVTNRGSAALNVTGASVSPAGTAFSFAPASFPVALAPNASTTLTARFNPSAAGAAVAQGLVSHDSGPDAVAQLSGNARAEPTVLVPASVDFGLVYVGTPSTREVAIRNLGPGTLSVRGIRVTGGGTARYSVSPTSFTGTLAPLASPSDTDPRFALSVTYLPVAPVTGAADVATVEIDTDDPDTPTASVAVSGTAILPVMTLDRTAVDFGVNTVGMAATPQDISVRNTGAGPLVITAVSIPNGTPFGFTLVGATLPVTLQAGGLPLVIRTTFTAPSAQAFSTALSISGTDAANPTATVTLSGSGKPCDPRAGASFVQSGASCTYACLANRWDLDGDLNAGTSNGCEYTCTFVTAVDNPDDAFNDDDCDGTDGDTALDVFVDGANGDNANAGTRTAPKRTIAEGINAAAGGRFVLVAQASYTESITLRNGVSVVGGYVAGNPRWVRTATNRASVQGGVTAVTATGISLATRLESLLITAANNAAASGSSIGVKAFNADGLQLVNLEVTAGTGGAGTNGANGTAGAGGGNGGAGVAGCDGCSGNGTAGTAGSPVGVCANGVAAGAGGTGGTGGYGAGSGTNGQTGGPAGTGGAGGGGGAGDGSHSCAWGCGSGGNPGGNGSAGAGGGAVTDANGGASTGTIDVNGMWQPSNGGTGAHGNNGTGGGGGGGGGGTDCCLDDRGGGGGGGGAGGCGGQRGTGGAGGGASIAVLAVASDLVIRDCTLRAGSGGKGGDAGSGGGGGVGGGGGAFGAAADDGDRGGSGAGGGNGARGAHGGGGGGGESWCVYRSGGAAPTLSGTTMLAGSAGLGGSSPGNAGAAGSAGQLK